MKDYAPNETKINRIKESIQRSPGIDLKELLQSEDIQFTADDIYALIAKDIIYIDLYNDLITDPENVKVFLNKEQYKGFSIVEKSSRSKRKTHAIELKSGNHIAWGDTVWTKPLAVSLRRMPSSR